MAMTPNYHAAYPGLLIAYMDDPAEAWVAARKLGAEQQHLADPQIKLEAKAPLQLAPGPVPMTGALIHGTEVTDGKPMVFLGTVIASRPSREGSWTLTMNLVHAPADRADIDLPILWAMMTSVRLDTAKLSAASMVMSQAMFEQTSKIMNDRYQANMTSMREKFEHSMAQARNTQDAIDRAAAGTVNFALDRNVVQYNGDGSHGTMSSDWASVLTRADPQNFSIVPMSQYVKGVDY